MYDIKIVFNGERLVNVGPVLPYLLGSLAVNVD